jgi:hypothetical protein
MIKIILYAIVAIVALLWIAEPKITISPFKVQLTRGWFMLGMALIGLGIGFVRYQGYKDGAASGIDTAFKYFKEEIQKAKA